MIIDGVKWACDACIRGHRVSGCTHSDRELKQIAKKGRPVSQCPHCRHLRKSRSAHVKCDCGEKHGHGKEQAAKKAGASGCCASTNTDKGENKATQCTCCHGGRCTCAVKKETPSLDTVPEFPQTRERKSSIGRPRIQSTQSESSLTTFANGHHKPTHKNHHGVHGVSPYTIAGHADHHRHSFLEDDAPQSVTSRHRRMKSVSDKSSLDLLSLSRAFTTGNPLLNLDHTLELTPRQPSTVRQTSSRIHPNLSVNTSQSQFNIHESFGQDFLQSADSDAHQFSAGLQPSAGWPSFQPFDLDFGYPGLTSSSSVDENDELSLQAADLAHSLTSTGPLPSEASDLGDDSYRLSAASSYIGLPQLMGGNRLDEYNMERYLVDFFQTTTPMETTKLNLERYLSDSSPQQSAYMDSSLNLSLTGDSGYDGEAALFPNTYLTQQPLHGSTDTLDLLASNIHSPVDTGLLLNMPTPMSPEEEGMVWMRKISNASTYQSNLDQNWHTPSQSQSPR